ncbi:hypothetical protein MKEN_00675900 [Mycena kentingensis (nom. inval.)]|nr:hypothetical protein MKEN_00675900 [Mycena kentingensis (nom. inval.)]
MEAKLKALKVAELRELLASETVPAKANKTDLIARIIASPTATDAYKAKYEPKDDLLAPPEEVDWDADADQPTAEVVVEDAEPAKSLEPEAVPTAAEPADVPASATTDAAEDPELAKRKARAERFGIPLVEQRTPVAKQQPKKAATAPAAAAKARKTGEPDDKLNARAARFGTGQKRSAPAVEEVDAEEAERRRKRAERFGLPIKDSE